MKPLSIFMINFDWRDMFRTAFDELKDKLDRDQLNTNLNNFFFFSWANESYIVNEGRFKTLHKKTRLYKLKPVLDILTVFFVPLTVRKYRLHPDAWLTYDFGMLPALWLASKLFGGKVVLCVSNQPRVYSRTRKFGAIKGFYSYVSEKLWWRLADHFFTINETMRGYLEDIGIPKSRITVFYVDTIDRDREHIEEAHKGTIRAKFNIPNDKKIILSVARLEAEKNFPKLIELFAGLGDGYVLVIIGRGSLLSQLETQIKSLGISNRVIFAGFVGRDQIWNYFMDADLFILLSKAEALGLVFWEAMHVNVPVIGSTADGIVETIGKDGERGRIWKESAGQAGFNEMVEFCVMPSVERDNMIKRAKEFVDKQRGNKVTFNDLRVFK